MWFLPFAVVILSVLATIFARRWVKTGRWSFLMLWYLTSAAAVFCLGFLVPHRSVNEIVDLSCAILLLGCFNCVVFKERITKAETVGLVVLLCGILAIFLRYGSRGDGSP